MRETNWEHRAAASEHYDTSLYRAACLPACSLQIFINLAALSLCVSNLAHTISSSHCTQLCKLHSSVIHHAALSETYNQLPTQRAYRDYSTPVTAAHMVPTLQNLVCDVNTSKLI